MQTHSSVSNNNARLAHTILGGSAPAATFRMHRPDAKSDHKNGFLPQSIQVSPSDLVKRQAIAWDGMAAEIVQATKNEKVEFHFRSPFHLLAVYEQGARSGGDSFVEGLPVRAAGLQTQAYLCSGRS